MLIVECDWGLMFFCLARHVGVMIFRRSDYTLVLYDEVTRAKGILDVICS